MFDESKNNTIKSILMAAMENERPKPAPFAEGEITLGDFLFRYDTAGRALLYRYLGDDEVVHVPGSIRIPGEDADRPVTLVIIGAFMQKENVREIYLGEGIEGAAGSFMQCGALERIHLPDSFGDVLNGRAVVVCPAFKGFSVKATNPHYIEKDGFLIRKRDRMLVCGPRDLSECVIPDGVTAIEESAFAYSGRLESVIIPEGVERIGESAFSHCPYLWEVQLPGSLQDIGEDAFWECPRLDSLGVPAGVTFAGYEERDFSLIMGCDEYEEEDGE